MPKLLMTGRQIDAASVALYIEIHFPPVCEKTFFRLPFSLSVYYAFFPINMGQSNYLPLKDYNHETTV